MDLISKYGNRIDMEWTTKVVHTEHYSFELKININEDGPIKNITFLIGNEVKPCLYLIVPMGARNNRMHGHIDTAMMINLEGLRECLSESVSNDYFSEYSFAKEVVHKMIQIINKFFPHIKRINLNDTSYIPCNRLEGDKLDLLTYSIALYGKTWYEKNFGAQQASSKYSEAVATYMKEKPVNFEEWYRFVKTYNIYAGRWIAERYDQIQNMFYASNTYPIFFKKLSDMIGFVEKCRVFNGWLLQFIRDRIPENRSWYIPLEMRGGGGGTRRRPSASMTRRSDARFCILL